MCDGTVRFIKTGIPDELFKAMVTYKGKDSTAGIDEWAPKAEFTSKLKTKPTTSPKLPEAAPGYVPKEWDSLAVRILGVTFGVALPPGPTDVTAQTPWENSFTGQWTQKKIALSVSARHIYGFPASDPSGALAQAEVTRYIDINSLSLDGSIVDAPSLGGSKGKQFRAKPIKDKDSKEVSIHRLWIVNGARLVLTASGGPDMKPADAEEFFKTATTQAGSGTSGPGVPGDIKAWQFYYNPSLKILVSFPGEPQSLPSDTNVFLYYPKEALGGALFTFAMVPAKLAPAVDVAKGYASLEAAVKEGQFGKDPRNITKKMISDRPGVAFDLLDGDTVFSTWAIYNNEESVVVMKVRKDAGLPPIAEKLFFGSLQFGVDKAPEKKKDNVGGPGVPPGGPGVPPGTGRPPGAGGMPPGGPPPVPPPPGAPSPPK
jgi:hypothetical protein